MPTLIPIIFILSISILCFLDLITSLVVPYYPDFLKEPYDTDRFLNYLNNQRFDLIPDKNGLWPTEDLSQQSPDNPTILDLLKLYLPLLNAQRLDIPQHES
ncbi:unnamed protein product [Gordionus sp. m RMFG-2023]